MTPIDLLGLVILGIATSLGLGVLAGGLLAFGEARFDLLGRAENFGRMENGRGSLQRLTAPPA